MINREKQLFFMVCELVGDFAHGSTGEDVPPPNEVISSGGVPTLATAFRMLGLKDPCFRKDLWDLTYKDGKYDEKGTN